MTTSRRSAAARAVVVGVALLVAAPACSSSSTHSSSTAALPPTTSAAANTATSTTLAPAAAKAATIAYLRGAGAPLLTFLRETAAFSGSTNPTGATLERCKQWVANTAPRGLTYQDLRSLVARLPTPELAGAFGNALFAEWIVLPRCQRPSELDPSQSRTAASTRAALLQELAAAGVSL